MPTRRLGLAIAGAALLLLATGSPRPVGAGALPRASSEERPEVFLIEVEGVIGPALGDHVRRGLDRAAAERPDLIVLRLDTPGGLDTTMREIIRAILDSPVPVAVHVAPGGARAASAGTYIVYASHLAAMAPGTHLGAATPVQLRSFDDSSERDPAEAKAVEDAVAYIRGLAELRGRDAKWAEEAVREAATLPSSEALERGVIELVADDVEDLLRQADGRTVRVERRDVVLRTAGARIERIEPDWRTRLLAVVTDPNVAFVLMMIGIYGVIFEFANPGSFYPGVIGAICLLLSLYGLALLPTTWFGLELLALGIGLMIAEVFAPGFGVLGAGGVVAFVFGAILLFDVPGFGVAWPVLAIVTALTAGFFLFVLAAAWGARRRPVTAGREEMIGATGRVVEWSGTRGRVHVHGERWSATSSGALEPGQPVRVTGLSGLVLVVEPDAEGNHI